MKRSKTSNNMQSENASHFQKTIGFNIEPPVSITPLSNMSNTNLPYYNFVKDNNESEEDEINNVLDPSKEVVFELGGSDDDLQFEFDDDKQKPKKK